MPAETLKTTVITALDAAPPTRSSSGQGGPGNVRSIDGTLTATTGKTAPSLYLMCRVPSNAKIKHVWIGVDGTVTTFTCDIGFYYSDNTQDGTQAPLQGTAVNSTTGSQLFGAGVDLKTAGLVDYVKTLVAAKRLQPVWQACGLSVDPGGFFDLVLTTTATNSGAPVAYAEVQYVE